MSHYKPYPAYRDSGVKWIGQVPEHWKKMPFKRVASICNGHDYKEVENADGAYPVIGSGGEFARASDFMFDGESVLLGRKGTIDKPLYINGPFWAVDTMFYTKIADNAFPKFVYYNALTIPFGLYSTNTALPSMAGEDLSSHLIVAPDFEEQKAIATCVDRETTRIDALITKKTRFIELLKEKRQALITHAVTKGLDPNVKMRDSGIDWIGEVPEQWNVVQVRHVATLGSGHTPSRSRPDWWEDCYIPWFTLADIWQVRREGRRFVTETEEKVSDLGIANSSAVVHPAGSVMLSRTASVGFPAIMGCDMATSQDFAVWRCGSRVVNEYLYLVLLGMKQELSRLMIGSTHKTIYMPDIEAFRMPLPSEEQQKLIVQYVGDELQRFDTLVAKTQRSIDLLRERRAAFITAAVTGQIDLRESA
jgi:type I restriction enzyme S subunit